MNPHKYHRVETPDMPNRQWVNRHHEKAPIWVSVDLRDGNQALANPMNLEQKLALWQVLIARGFKTIEVAFPSASQVDFDFVRHLIEKNLIPDDVTIQVLVQAREHLIARTFESLAGVKRAIVHVYNTTSAVQREKVFQKSRQEIKQMAEQGARWVQQYALNYPQTDWTFQYSPESFSQTEMDFALEVCEAVVDIWQPTVQHKAIINLPATVESTSPNRFADQIEYFITHFSRRDAVLISVHTHNDRGCAVAAAELALLAGADRVEGTLLGNGERTGNMDIITLAMNLYSEGIDPCLDLSSPDDWTPVIESVTGFEVHPRHPWVGREVYTAYSGGHQDAIHKCLNQQKDNEPWQVAYLPIDPKDIGRNYEAVIRVNSQSGKSGVAHILQTQLGIQLPKWLQEDFSRHVQQHSEQQGGVVSAQTITQLFDQVYESNQSVDVGDYACTQQGEHKHCTWTVNGEAWQGLGNGIISALCQAWQDKHHQTVEVIDYAETALSLGKDATALACMRVVIDGRIGVGVAKSHDSGTAMIKAFYRVVKKVAQSKLEEHD